MLIDKVGLSGMVMNICVGPVFFPGCLIFLFRNSQIESQGLHTIFDMVRVDKQF